MDANTKQTKAGVPILTSKVVQKPSANIILYSKRSFLPYCKKQVKDILSDHSYSTLCKNF